MFGKKKFFDQTLGLLWSNSFRDLKGVWKKIFIFGWTVEFARLQEMKHRVGLQGKLDCFPSKKISFQWTNDQFFTCSGGEPIHWPPLPLSSRSPWTKFWKLVSHQNKINGQQDSAIHFLNEFVAKLLSNGPCLNNFGNWPTEKYNARATPLCLFLLKSAH